MERAAERFVIGAGDLIVDDGDAKGIVGAVRGAKEIESFFGGCAIGIADLPVIELFGERVAIGVVFVDLKNALDRLVGNAKTIRIT